MSKRTKGPVRQEIRPEGRGAGLGKGEQTGAKASGRTTPDKAA